MFIQCVQKIYENDILIIFHAFRRAEIIILFLGDLIDITVLGGHLIQKWILLQENSAKLLGIILHWNVHKKIVVDAV